MKNKKYIIREECYYDKFGKLETKKYYIQYLWSTFLGFKIWFDIVHSSYGGETILYFGTIEEAEAHIENVLIKELPTERWVSKKIKEITYSFENNLED